MLVGIAGCGPVPAAERGAELFGSPSLSAAPTNVFSCATCHSVREGGDADRRPSGYTLWNAFARPTWWGGEYRALIDAVSFCLVEFMRGERLSFESVDGRALQAYLRSIAPAPTSEALPLTVVKDIVDLPNGDAGRGAMVWRRSCAGCHGDLHTGNGRLGPRVSIVPGETVKTFPGMARLIIIEKVRHGKFFAIGGNMPLFSKEALSDEGLRDLMAYIGI